MLLTHSLTIRNVSNHRSVSPEYHHKTITINVTFVTVPITAAAAHHPHNHINDEHHPLYRYRAMSAAPDHMSVSLSLDV